MMKRSIQTPRTAGCLPPHITFHRWAVLALLGSVLAACDDLTSVLPDASPVNGLSSGALYVLCDGNFALNNSTLALFDATSGRLEKDFFQAMSGRKLGDTGNDLQRYGDKVYIVVTTSSQLEVLHATTGEPILQIPLFDGPVARQPRNIAFWDDKAYVCSFDGTVVRIDTARLDVEAVVRVGRNPDGLSVANGKLYVANSGGLDYGSAIGYDQTVSVVDLTSFRETARIPVGRNPHRVLTDDRGFVWVTCRGDYAGEAGSLWCLDSGTDKVVAQCPMAVTNMAFHGPLAYMYHYNHTDGSSSILVFNLLTHKVEREAFITDGTQIKTPYALHVDSESGDVYVSDAGDYVSAGSVCCFSPEGRLRFTLKQVGVSPNHVLYVPDFDRGLTRPDTTTVQGEFIENVYAYEPSPGQFVGMYPAWAAGDDAESLRQKAEQRLRGRLGGLVTLGRFGGRIDFGFSGPVRNHPGMADFRIYGNAFAGGAEPGIVAVAVDVNGNGLPDDPWYELAGSAHDDPRTLRNYRVVYYRPAQLTDSVVYRDNQGAFGRVRPGYPAWMGDSIVRTGTLLPPTATQQLSTSYWTSNPLAWGYVDNLPNNATSTAFDLDWAVDASGHPVQLDSIHFIRVYTGVNQDAGWLGELSTEVTGAEMLGRQGGPPL